MTNQDYNVVLMHYSTKQLFRLDKVLGGSYKSVKDF